MFAGQLTWFIAALLGRAPEGPGNGKATRIIGILAIALALLYLLVQSFSGNGAAFLACIITFVCLTISWPTCMKIRSPLTPTACSAQTRSTTKGSGYGHDRVPAAQVVNKHPFW